MEKIERKNIAEIRPSIHQAVDKVRLTKEPIIIQRHNIDQVAIVSLEALDQITKKDSGKK